jgi:hypothetical protein
LARKPVFSSSIWVKLSNNGVSASEAIDMSALFQAQCEMDWHSAKDGAVMKLGRCLMIVALVCSASTAAMARVSGPTLRDRQQAACYNDAQRLCGEFVPDVDKITACMESKRSEVSHKCRKMMKETR